MSYTSGKFRMLALILAIIQISCTFSGMRETEHPLKPLTESFLPGKTSSQEVQKVLGEPAARIEARGIEIYSNTTQQGSSATAAYFALFVYNTEHVLQSFALCVESWKFLCQTEDYILAGRPGTWYLLAPLEESQKYFATSPEPDECVLYMFALHPFDYVVVDGAEIGTFFSRDTYLRLRLATGPHWVSIAHYYGSVSYLGETALYCEPGRTFYMQIQRGGSFFNPKMKLAVTDARPAEVEQRRLILRTNNGYTYGSVFTHPSMKAGGGK